MNTTSDYPQGTSFLLVNSKKALSVCLDNEVFYDLYQKFTPKDLVALAINIPFHVSKAETYIETIEGYAPDIINVLSDLYQLEHLYDEVSQEIDLQLSVSGEDFHSHTPLFWRWVGQHTLMLAHHHEPSSYKTLQKLSKDEVEKHLVTYGQRLPWSTP